MVLFIGFRDQNQVVGLSPTEPFPVLSVCILSLVIALAVRTGALALSLQMGHKAISVLSNVTTEPIPLPFPTHFLEFENNFKLGEGGACL